MLKCLHVRTYAISTLCASSKCSCKTAQMRRLVWANTVYTWDKYLYLTKWHIAHWRRFQMRTNIWAPLADLSPFALAHQIYPSLVLVQPRKTCPCLTEILLMGRKESIQTKKKTEKLAHQTSGQFHTCFIHFHTLGEGSGETAHMYTGWPGSLLNAQK